jgi:protein-S-isoprenylcysteine O-methyltransferase Ste14
MRIDANVMHLIWLAAAWLGYFVFHSVLASLACKRLVAAHWPRLMPAYRLGYNALALLLLAFPLVLTYAAPGPWLWRWSGALQWLSAALSLAAIGGFLWSLKYYDMHEFVGLRQLQGRIESVEDQENFHLSPLHRYVRHPWYFLGLVLIWTRDMNSAMLLSAALMTLYLYIGSRLEEAKLVQYHGPVYLRYIERVPGLVPLPWRFLSVEQARQLTATQDLP